MAAHIHLRHAIARIIHRSPGGACQLLKELAPFAPSGKFEEKLLFADHHQSHAAAAFFPSPFDEAVILTLDGVGEWTTASVSIGKGNTIETEREIKWPHSLGLLYSAFTYYTGFRVNSGEYKVMGLAPYGNPKYADLILKHLVNVAEDGSFWMDQSYFDYATGLTMTNKKFERLFGGPPRSPESPLTQRDMDLAASVQVVTEDIMLRITRDLGTGSRHACVLASRQERGHNLCSVRYRHDRGSLRTLRCCR